MKKDKRLSKPFKKQKYLAYYLLGLIDGEGCFSVAVKKQEGTRFGWVLDPVFHITQHKSAKAVLELAKEYFHCGRIIPKPGQEDTLQFIVENRKQIAQKIIPFLNKYKPIIKARDFQLFKEIVEGLERKEHSTLSGFKRLLQIAFSMNMRGKQRRYSLEKVLESLERSSETLRQTPAQAGDDRVQPTQ